MEAKRYKRFFETRNHDGIGITTTKLQRINRKKVSFYKLGSVFKTSW